MKMMRKNQNKNHDMINKPQSRLISKAKSIKKSLKYILFAIPFFQSAFPISPANAVMNIPPSSSISKLKEESASIDNPQKQQNRPSSRPDLVEPDPSHPKYHGKQDSYEMDLRIYQAKLKAREEELLKRQEEQKRIRPTKPNSQEQLEQQSAALQMLQQLPSSSSSTSSAGTDSTTASTATTSQSFKTPKVKVAAVPKTKGQKKIKTSKQRAKQVTVQTVRYGGFITAGVIFAKAQAEKERVRVQQGIEIFESQKAEYFNVTGKSDTDEDLANELKGLKGNSTDTDEDDDDDDDDGGDGDEDGDVPTRRKPPGNGGGGPSGSGGPSPSPPKKDPPVRDQKASDDDIERMKNLFNK